MKAVILFIAFCSTASIDAADPPAAATDAVAPDGAAQFQMEISRREPGNKAPGVAAAQAPVVGDRVSVLVHFDPASDPIHRPGTRAFALARGAFVKYEYEILPNVINIRNLPRQDMAALRTMPGVVKVEEDQVVHAMLNDSVAAIRGMQWHISASGMDATGAGVRICVIDSGIDSNSIMYSSRIDTAAGWDFVNDDPDPEDDDGHGSHVAGIALGGTGITADFPCPSVGPEPVQGVAPQATLIGVKVLDAMGNGFYTDFIAGINWCASTTLPGGQADVINMSLGSNSLFTGTCDSDSTAQASNNAVNAGVVVVAAAGNDGAANGINSPACGSQVIAVAATYDDNFPNCDFPSQTSFSFCLNQTCTSQCTDNSPSADQRCCFSNRSSKINVAAPGCRIFSDNFADLEGDSLVGECGTSMAAPHVAGLAALLLGVNPLLTPAQVQQIIQDRAVDLGTPGFDTSYGWGRIDVTNSLYVPGPSRSIKGWGYNLYGQTNVPAPNTGFVAVAAGAYHGLGLKANGSIVAWGCIGFAIDQGQCDVPAPNTGFVAVAGGLQHSLGLKADGSIVAWGLNTNGQTDVPAPNTGFVTIAAAGHHSLGLKSDGSIVAWGNNGSGQTDVPAPNADFIGIAAGGGHSLGLKSDGSIVAWGANSFGQTNVPAPNTGFVALAAGGVHSLGIKADGSIVGWGNNFSGQTNAPAPNTGFVAVAGGANHSLGLKSDGSTVRWGSNNHGQINAPDPNTGFVAIAAGGDANLGVTTDCNGNGIADGCDVDCAASNGLCNVPGCGLSMDCDSNDIPDECENPNPNTIGACCSVVNNVQSCSNVTAPVCTTPLNGMWGGPCTKCPVQNVAIIIEPGGSVFAHVIGPPVECELPPGPKPAVDCPPGEPLRDPWISPPNVGSMCHNFGVGPQSPAIPAGFFGPGSDAFSGSVCLKGSSLGDPLFGNTDTIIERSADPFDRCAAPSGTPSAVSIEVVALSLVSVNPMTVTYNGGQSPETWNVAVDLSTVTPPPGTLTATKSHCNGGTYTSTLNVQPRFTFTKVSDPMQIRLLDTGAVAIPPVTLNQTTPAPWVHDVDPNLILMGDPCSAFHAGVSQQNPQTACDCNANLVRDLCDIEQGTSADCNLNEVPDDCDSFTCNDSNPCTDETCSAGVGCHYSFNVLPCDADGPCIVPGSGVCTNGHCAGTPIVVLYGDVAPPGGNGLIDVDDILYVLDSFSDPVGFPEGDIAPCGGNALVDVDDILAVLEAFTGNYACPHPCPP